MDPRLGFLDPILLACENFPQVPIGKETESGLVYLQVRWKGGKYCYFFFKTCEKEKMDSQKRFQPPFALKH